MPLLIYIEKAGRVLLALLGFFLIALVISSTTDLGSPYKEGANSPVPQRYVILNTNREFYDSNMALKRQDSGYFIVNQDPNSPRTAPLANRSFASLRQDCEDEFYCGVPLHTTWMNSLSPTSHWIVAMDRNEFSTPTKVVSSKSCYEDSSNCTVHLTITGPERLTVTLSPKVGVTLQSWSLDQGLEPTPHSRWRNRPTFFLQIHRTNAAETFQFTLNFKVEINQIPGMLMDLSVTGNYFQADAVSGSGPEAFKQFLSSFPQWADVTSWSSFYSSHII